MHTCKRLCKKPVKIYQDSDQRGTVQHLQWAFQQTPKRHWPPSRTPVAAVSLRQTCMLQEVDGERTLHSSRCWLWRWQPWGRSPVGLARGQSVRKPPSSQATTWRGRGSTWCGCSEPAHTWSTSKITWPTTTPAHSAPTASREDKWELQHPLPPHSVFPISPFLDVGSNEVQIICYCVLEIFFRYMHFTMVFPFWTIFYFNSQYLSMIICTFGRTCRNFQIRFLLLTDSEAPGFSAWLAAFQSLQQAALQRPPPLCGLLAAQLQLTGKKQLGPRFEFGELWQRSAGREPLRLGKVCPFSAQRGPGHVCHSWD